MNRTIKERVLELLPNNQATAITSRELMQWTGLSFRELKEVITELRIEYPVCAKERNGGGYWISAEAVEIREFVNMIARRRDGYNRTIEVMTGHLLDDEVN